MECRELVQEQKKKIEAKYHQIDVNEALKYEVADLFKDEDNNKKLISRADIVLIMTIYQNGLHGFLDEYKNYVQDMKNTRGYKFVSKPHYYLKSIIG